MIFSETQGSVNSAFKKLSYDKISITGTIRGWYRMDITNTEYTSLRRDEKLSGCLRSALLNGYRFTPDDRIMIITYPKYDLFG